jgi:hypothetical protein
LPPLRGGAPEAPRAAPKIPGDTISLTKIFGPREAPSRAYTPLNVDAEKVKVRFESHQTFGWHVQMTELTRSCVPVHPSERQCQKKSWLVLSFIKRSAGMSK